MSLRIEQNWKWSNKTFPHTFILCILSQVYIFIWLACKNIYRCLRILKHEMVHKGWNIYILPVSNFAFISKLVETVVAKQLQHYLNFNNLFPAFQSAYRQNHSTETALLKVMNGILLNMNNQFVTLLILLDLCAAFDTCYVDLNTHSVYRESPLLVCILIVWKNSADNDQRVTI